MMRKRATFDLVVFDWDGTLMNSTRNIARALQASFSDHGLPEPDNLAVRYVIGLGLDEAFQYLAPGLSRQQIKGVINTYRIHCQKSANRPVLYEGVAQWLSCLQQAGYQLAVATGKSRAGLNDALQETGLGPYFTVTRTADETFSKPHPQMLHEIFSVLGIEKHRALVVGDTTHDLQMAMHAGCSAVAMSYGAHDVEALLTCTPLHIFADFHALGAWLVSP